MTKVNTSEYQSFDQITARLDSIVDQVRDKDISLEHSLDLFDEAIALGSKAVTMVDTTEFTTEEEERLVQIQKDSNTVEDTVSDQVENLAEGSLDTKQDISVQQESQISVSESNED